MSQCCLLETVKRLNRKVCDVNGCSLPHSFLLHPDQGRASFNIFTVLEEDDVDGEEPASKDEEEDDQSPRAKLLRGILQAGRSVLDDQPPEDDTKDPAGAVRERRSWSLRRKRILRLVLKRAWITAAWKL